MRRQDRPQSLVDAYIMAEFKPTWLYLKQHNDTGLKYFGKTIRDPEMYKGSGKYWVRHIKQHGYNVTTVWKKLFTDREELTQYALQYSIDHNIVESAEYANLKPEDGLMGGYTKISPEGRERLRKKALSYKHSPESREKIKAARKKQTPPMLNKHHSEETKQKIKAARAHQVMPTGKVMTEETKAKIFTKERALKISEAKKGKKFSEEHRRKLSEAHKARHAKRTT